jgi:hypothetical protein
MIIVDFIVDSSFENLTTPPSSLLLTRFFFLLTPHYKQANCSRAASRKERCQQRLEMQMRLEPRYVFYIFFY